jgi:hypothetical protein
MMPGGDEVDGEVTLDNCGYDFSTAALRRARRQYLITPPDDGHFGFSNEVVAYGAATD